jgi:nitroreductase
MDIRDAILSRRSVRAFTGQPVSRELLAEVLEVARRAPSALNTQPWELTVVSGEVLDNIRRGNIEKLRAGAEFGTEMPHHQYTGVYRQRQINLAVDLFRLMGIAREDREKRTWWLERGFRFFDAPAAVIISIDRELDGSWALFDIGCLAQTICLTAMQYGLGTCIEDQGTVFSDVVRQFTGIPENRRIIVGIAVGFPDPDFPANSVCSAREDVDAFTSWLGF